MTFPWRESALNLRSYPRGLFYIFFFIKTMTQCHSQITNLHLGTTLTEIQLFCQPFNHKEELKHKHFKFFLSLKF